MITQQTLDRVFEAANVLDVIQPFVELKKSGANWKGLSPFVQEKTGSFMVSPSKNIYKCFSSGKGGKPVTFLMDYKGMTYPEAIEHLANLYNIPVEHDAKAQTAEEVDHLTQLDRTLRASANLYQKALHDALPDSVPVLELYRNRGLTKDTVLQWQLGWAPDEWRTLTDKVVPVGLFEIARELGLCNHKNGNNYDVYRGRIIFPIHDQADRLIGFGGRDLTGKDNIPKYLNSPETRLYHKERVLYGLNHAAQHIRTAGFAVVVEGYYDVISLHQAGCPQAVATCGTALTDAHLTILKRYTNHLVFGFDGDAAGQKALYKAVASAVKFGFKVDALVLPAAEDPDSLARNWTAKQPLVEEEI